jgi:hypothetical protein
MGLKDIYASGGTLWYREGAVWVKIGLVQNLNLKVATETEEVMDHEEATEQVFDEVVLRTDYSISFESKQVNADTLQKMFMTSIETGLANPTTDGIAGATTVTKMELGKGTQWVGPMKFESNNARGEEMLAMLNKVSLKPEGELALLGKSVASMSFNGKCGKDSNGDTGYLLRKES